MKRGFLIPGVGMLIGLVVPLVPVWYAPVVPDPIYHFKLISAFQAISAVILPLYGISYRWAWYTPLAILLLPAAGLALGFLVRRAMLPPRKG